MLRLIHQCEDTIRSKLSESNSETCSRDFSFVGPRTIRNYFIRYTQPLYLLINNLHCFDLFFREFYMLFLRVLNNGSRHKRETVVSAIETRTVYNDAVRLAGLNPELQDRVRRLIRAFYFHAMAKGGRSYSPIFAAGRCRLRGRGECGTCYHEVRRKMIRANSRFRLADGCRI